MTAIHKTILTAVLFSTVSVLWAQDDANLINITTIEQLDAMRYDLDGSGVADVPANATAYSTAFGMPSCASTYSCEGYELMNDLDFSGSRWAEGASGSDAVAEGWLPIGKEDSSFCAVFEGNNYKISNMYINRPDAYYVGLFEYVGTGSEIRNLGIEGGSVTGGYGVGGLVGHSEDGTISGSYATGNATGGRYAGGLVGHSEDGTISGCYATGMVEAEGNSSRAGGLVGHSEDGTISGCYATGTATATSNDTGAAYAGGLVGSSSSSYGSNSNSTISGCYATGNATTTGIISNSTGAGGLVGNNDGGTINDCYAEGTATATSNDTGDAYASYAYAGGLVGNNSSYSSYSTISGCYATGTATATSNGTGGASAGGLVGSNSGSSSTISGCYAEGTATATSNDTGDAYAGGLMGRSGGTISGCYAEGTATATSNDTGDAYAGGLMGRSGGTISGCYAEGTATATSNGTGAAYAGGLVGSSSSSSSISGCYAEGTATATSDTGNAYAGGLVGSRSSSISGCYATGNAEAAGTSSYAGGLVGLNNGKGSSITACYSIGNATATGSNTFVSGLVGYSGFGGRITYSYFDSDVSNRPTTDQGALTTSALQSPTDYSNIYENWTMTSTWEENGDEFYLWAICGASEYPKLYVDFNGDGTPTVDEFGSQGSCTQLPPTPPTDPSSPSDPPTTEERVTASEDRNEEQSDSLRTHDTEITALETGQAALETSQQAQDTEIAALEMNQETHDTEIASLKTSQQAQDTEIAALKAEIEALKGAMGGGSETTFNVPATTPNSTQAYPNPASKSLRFSNLSPNHSYTYKIYTTAGWLALIGSLRGDKKVDISMLSAGQYILLLQDENGNEVLRSSLLVK